MSASGTHHLVLLLVFCLTWAASLYLPKMETDTGHALVYDALVSMMSGPLGGRDLVVVADTHSQHLVDVGGVVWAAGVAISPVVVASQRSLLHTRHPARHTKGTRLTVIFFFHDDPTAFLLLLTDNTNWNPHYLVLFCLDSQLNASAVLSQPVVQRSYHILLLQMAYRESAYTGPAHGGSAPRLHAYTSLPMQVSTQGRSLLLAPLGVWRPEKFNSRQALFPSRFQDFGGQMLELSAWCDDVPLLYAAEDGNCTGQTWDALRTIADKFNFKFSSNFGTSDGKWGSFEDGHFVGMLGEIIHGEKDLIINSVLLDYDTVNAFDYTYPYTIYSYKFMIKVPPPVPQWRNVLYPFPTLMWGLILVTTVFVAAVLSFLLYLLEGLHDPLGFSLRVAAGLVGQAMEGRAVRVWWARVWLVVWWVVVDILAAAYMSNLVAVLTVPVLPTVYETVEDLAMADVRVAMLDYGSPVPHYLKSSKTPTLSAIGRKLDMGAITNWADLYQEIVQRVRDGTHALIIFGDYMDYIRQRQNMTRTTYVMKEKIYWSALSWFLPLHTPYTPIISHTLTSLKEMGVLEKLYMEHMGRIFYPNTKTRGDVVLNLGHVQGAFILLGLCVVAAFISLLLERLTAAP